MTKYIVKSYLAIFNRITAFIDNFGSLGLAIIYTIGHIGLSLIHI